MSYRIQIKEIKDVVRSRRSWEKLRDSSGPGDENYGYAPEISVKEKSEVVVADIAVESLDVPKIMAVIYGIQP